MILKIELEGFFFFKTCPTGDLHMSYKRIALALIADGGQEVILYIRS